MEKVVRIGKLADQDNHRRDDIRELSPNERVQMILEMQSRYFRWDINPRMERSVKLKRLNFRDVS